MSTGFPISPYIHTHCISINIHKHPPHFISIKIDFFYKECQKLQVHLRVLNFLRRTNKKRNGSRLFTIAAKDLRKIYLNFIENAAFHTMFLFLSFTKLLKFFFLLVLNCLGNEVFYCVLIKKTLVHTNTVSTILNSIKRYNSKKT